MALIVKDYISDFRKDAELWVKVEAMTQHIVSNFETDLSDVRDKYKNPDKLSEQAIKEIIRERGFDYIVSVMDTINNFQFNTLVSFIDLIGQLKGTRPGLELVLTLLGFDSIIQEWWEGEDDLFNPVREPLTYEIIVFVNSSFVPDVFATLDQVQFFSENYVLGKIDNVEVRFLFDVFAERGVIMGGFITPHYFGEITERAVP
jgi:hypothetical protein